MSYMSDNGAVFTLDGVRLLISKLNNGALHKNAYKDEPDKEKVNTLIDAKRQFCYDFVSKIETEYVKQKQRLCVEANGCAAMGPVSELEAIETRHALERSLKRKAMEEEYETSARLKRKAKEEEYETDAMIRRKAMEAECELRRKDPLKKSQYELELAQTQLATEKVKREAAALAGVSAKAPQHAKAPRKPTEVPHRAEAVEACVNQPLAEACVNQPLAEAGDDNPQPPPTKAADNKPKKRRAYKPEWPRLPHPEVWKAMSYEEKLAARNLRDNAVKELRELGVVPKLKPTAISRAAAARTAYQNWLAAKKIFDDCTFDTTSPHKERLRRNMEAADAACLTAQKRVPRILDPKCTKYCERCHHQSIVCDEHRLKFDVCTQDPAEFYAKAGRC
jgi:hypothetical protein